MRIYKSNSKDVTLSPVSLPPDHPLARAYLEQPYGTRGKWIVETLMRGLGEVETPTDMVDRIVERLIAEGFTFRRDGESEEVDAGADLIFNAKLQAGTPSILVVSR